MSGLTLQQAIRTLDVADKAAVLALLREYRVPIQCSENHGGNCPIYHYLRIRSGSQRHHVTYWNVTRRKRNDPVWSIGRDLAELPVAARQFVRAFAEAGYGKVAYGFGIPGSRVPAGSVAL